MSEPISLPALTTTQEFGTAPFEKRLAALDTAFGYNANIFDETAFDKTPLSRNDPWVKGRSLLANTYSDIRNKVAVSELHSRLQQHANESGEGVDPSTVSRILEGGDLDEEEDPGGKLRGLVENWRNDLIKNPGVTVRKDSTGAMPPLTSFPLLNPKDENDVLGHVRIFGDGKTRPYAEVAIRDKDNESGDHVFTRVLLDDDKDQRIKSTQADLAKASATIYQHALNPTPPEIGIPAEGMEAMDDRTREIDAKRVLELQSKDQSLRGPQGLAVALQDQVLNKLKEAPYIDKIGEGGFIKGTGSAIGSVLTSGMGMVPGVMSLLGIGTDVGPVQHFTDPETVNRLITDQKAGKLEGQVLTPYLDKEGNQGVSLRMQSDVERMQRDQEDVRNMFPRHSRAEFQGGTMNQILVGATDDALPFLADLYSGMALAKGVMAPIRLGMASKAAALTEDAAKLSAMAGLGNAAADLNAVTASAKASEASLVAIKNIGKYTLIPESLISAMPMTVKAAAHGWSEAMASADEYEAQGDQASAKNARDNAFNSAWANFATGEGLAMLPMMRMLKNGEGSNLLKQADELMSQRTGWDKLLHQQIITRAEKAAEFGAWSGAVTFSSNAWAKGLYDKNRELFQGVPESTAVGMIQGIALARFSGIVDPREVQQKRADIHNDTESVQRTQQQAAESMRRAAAGASFDNFATVAKPEDMVDLRTADGKWVINNSATPAIHGMEFESKEKAMNFAATAHRKQFFVDIAEYQTRTGMKPEEVEAQNAALGSAMDNISRLAGIDPERYYASITVRDRPEGEEGVHPTSPENMKSRIDNLFDLIKDAQNNKVPQMVLDRMLARHSELSSALEPQTPPEQTPPTAPQRPEQPPPVRENPWEKMPTPALERAVEHLRVNPGDKAWLEEAQAELTKRQAAAPPDKGTVTPPAQTAPPEAQPGTVPPVAKTSQSKSGTERRANPEWYKDKSIPQPEFERRVTDELTTLQRLEAEERARFQAGQLPEDQLQTSLDWITKRQSDLQKEEVARNDANRKQADALNADLKAVMFKLQTVNDAIRGEQNPRIRRATGNKPTTELLKQREALQKQQQALASQLQGLNGRLNQKDKERNASIYPLADQGHVIIETYKSANATSLIHEIAHTWTLMADPVTGKTLLEAALGEKAAAFNSWATGGGKVGVDSVPYHEAIATGLERYLAEGKAPTPELKGVFAKLASMVRRVYRDIQGLGIPLTDEARAGYDRIFNPKAEPEAVKDGERLMTPEEAAAKADMFADTAALGIHQLNDPEFRRGLGMIDPGPDEVMPETGAPARLDQGPSTVDDWRTRVWTNKEAVKRKMADMWARPGFWQKWENFIPAGLRSRGRMPESMFEAKAAAHNLKDAITTRAQILSDGMYNAVKDALGIKVNALNAEMMNKADRTAFNAMLRDVNSALMGKDHPAFAGLPRPQKLAIQRAAIDALPPNVRPYVLAMRAHIDSLSRALIATGAIQGPLVATLDANKNFYLHRSYEFFDNPLHGPKVRKNNQALMDQSINEFVAGGMPRPQAEAEVEYLLNRNNFIGSKSPNEGFAKYVVDRRLSTIFKGRSDIPEHIRNLWGEYKDPVLNYAKTVAKQASALTTFQYHLQTLSDGVREGWLTPTKTKEHNAEIFKGDDQSSKNSPRKSPLSGYYTTPEIGGVFQEAQKAGLGVDNVLLNILAGGNWIAKNNVFTWNPASHVRNAMGSALLYFSNGHFTNLSLFSHAKDAAAAHTGILPEFWQRTLANNIGLDRTAAENERVRLTKLGLLGQNVDIGVLHNLAKRFTNGVLGKDDALNTVGSHLEGLVHKTQRGMEEAIQAEDSFWKVMHFYSEYKVLRDAHPSTGPSAKTNGELEVIAAGRTLDVMPSWDRVVPWAKKFSSNPFMGTFVSFRAETMRNTYNALKYGVQDLQTPGMRWHGIRRLAGMTSLRVGQTAAATAMTKMLMGSALDPDTEKKARLFMAPWDADATHAFVSVGDGKIRHLNLSYIFPMSETIDAIRHLGTGGSLPEQGWKAFAKTFEPFLNEEFSLRLMHQITFNKDDFGRQIYNPEDTIAGAGWDVISQAGSMMLEPALLKNAKRIVRAHEGVGTESPASAWSRIVGLRVNEIDVRKSLGMVTADVSDRLANAERLFTKHFDPRSSDADRESGFAKMNERRAMLMSKLHDLYDGAIATGVPQEDAIRIMDKAIDPTTHESLNKGELAAAILGTSTYLPPYRLSKTKFFQAYQKSPELADKILQMTIPKTDEPVK